MLFWKLLQEIATPDLQTFVEAEIYGELTDIVYNDGWLDIPF